MTNSPSKWTEDKTQLDDMIDENVTAFKQNGKYNLTVLIPSSLLDQLRRDAKEEQAQIDVEEYQDLLQKKKTRGKVRSKKRVA